MKDCIIVDIDQTIADYKDRHPFKELDKVLEDEPKLEIIDLVNSYCSYTEAVMVVLTGRADICKDDTIKWLSEYEVEYQQLYMRLTDDYRPATVVKQEIYSKFIANKYNVVLAFDDNEDIIQMWKSLGIQTLKV